MTIYCQFCGQPTCEEHRDGRLRPVCTGCGRAVYLDPKLAVGVVIARGDEVLLGLRGEGSRESGRWSFPAGFVERGERVEDAAIREVREEAGVEIALGPLIGLYSRTGETVVLAVYAAAEVSGVETAGDDLTQLGWFSLDALPELAFSHDERILADWRTLRDRQR